MKKLNRWNRLVAVIMMVALCASILGGCGKNEATNSNSGKDEGKINVVATIFPEYDFLRQIGGDHINLTMLLKPGAESHSYEPTPQDIMSINKSDVFVYVGGDSDEWVKSIIESVDMSKKNVVTLMDCVDLVEEEVVEGMTPEKEEEEAEAAEKSEDSGKSEDAEKTEDTKGTSADSEEEEEVEYDEHVWTSPRNSKLIVQKLCDNLCEADSKNAEEYKKNTEAYLAKLDQLDGEFKDVVSSAKRKEIVVGDRFPFRYFVDSYGLTYYAAFPGCSTDTEPSAETIAFLTDKVKQDGIPVVFHIELSNAKVCNSICENTGAKSELLNAVHNVSKTDFDAGITYIDLMEHNVEVLKTALN